MIHCLWFQILDRDVYPLECSSLQFCVRLICRADIESLIHQICHFFISYLYELLVQIEDARRSFISRLQIARVKFNTRRSEFSDNTVPRNYFSGIITSNYFVEQFENYQLDRKTR